VVSEILGLRGVNHWEPDGRAPGKREAKMVKSNINSAQVPGDKLSMWEAKFGPYLPFFVDKKVNDI
jgi:hypothetical protein